MNCAVVFENVIAIEQDGMEISLVGPKLITILMDIEYLDRTNVIFCSTIFFVPIVFQLEHGENVES